MFNLGAMKVEEEIFNYPSTLDIVNLNLELSKNWPLLVVFNA
jgi:hypothetical protein